MKKLRKMFELACAELKWDAKDWIRLPEYGDDENMMDVGGATFTKVAEDEYHVCLLDIGDRGALKITEEETIEGTSFAVCYAMKHLLYNWLIEILPLKLEEEPLTFIA